MTLTHQLTGLIAAFTVATACVAPASASVVVAVNDTFTSGTAADNGYYRFGTTNTTLATDNGTGTLNYAYASGATNRSGVIKQFSSVAIEEGETLIFSFTLDARTLRDDENNSFRWSIGNIGTAVTGDLASAEPFSSGTRRNYVFTAATGTASTAFNQHSSGFSSPVNGGTTTSIGGLATSNYAHSSSDPFSISVSFTRTASGLDISKDFGGSVSMGSFATSNAADFVFNTLAFSMNNAGVYDISLSDVSVVVIPEPASLALMGLGGLLMLGRRRGA